MLTIRDCQTLRAAYASDVASPLAEAGVSAADLVDFAASNIAHPDRNVRVLMLRLLAFQSGECAMRAVLRGLRDDGRRVCAVAIQACPNFMAYADIVAQLVVIARDRRRKRKLRRRALSMLCGDEGRWSGDLTEPMAAALKALMDEDEYRFAIVFGLVRLELAPGTQSLLRGFAASADANEAEMARRALSGEIVIHLDRFVDDETQRQRIVDNHDLAHGRMYYWLPRDASE